MRRSNLLVILCALLFLNSPAAAQDCLDYSDYLRRLAFIAGGGYNIDVQGDFAYAASTGSMRILDISDPENPYWRGSAPIAHWPRGVAVSGDVAYVVEEPYNSLLHAIDIRDPDHPAVISTLPSSGWCHSIVVFDNIAYALCGGLRIFDVSDPSLMVALNSVNNLSDENDLSVNGGVVAVASSYFENHGYLNLIDVSDPGESFLACKMSMPGPALAVDLSGQYAFVVGEIYLPNPSHGYFCVVDISDISAPELVVQLEMASIPRSVSVRDDTAYVMDSERKLTTYNIADPLSPVVIGQIDVGGLGWNLVFSGDYGIASVGGISIIDCSSAATPLLTGHLPDVLPASRVAVVNEVAHVATGLGGLKMVDVSAPAQMSVVGTLLRDSVDDVAVTPGAILVASNPSPVVGGSILAVDTINPAVPAVIGSVAVGRKIVAFSVAGNMAYVSCDLNEFHILDVGEPTDLVKLGEIVLPDECRDAAVHGSNAYVASGDAGLQIVDVANPALPLFIDSIKFENFTAHSVTEHEGYLYVTGSGPYDRLGIVDVRDPDFPKLVGMDGTPGSTDAVRIVDQTMYVSAQGAGILVYNIADPAAPILLGQRSFDSPTTDLDVVGNYVFSAIGDGGLVAVPAQCSSVATGTRELSWPSNSRIEGIQPNPFNPQTTISFDLSRRESVNLRVFDVAGRLVRVLVDREVYSQGRHEVVWNGRDTGGCKAASGMYFCRFETGDYVQTKRVTLLK